MATHVVLDSLLTALMLFVPALIIGVAIQLIAILLRRSGVVTNAPLLAASAGGLILALVIKRLEPGYFDFIISWYAVAAGAVAGALVYWRVWRRFATDVTRSSDREY